MPRLKNHLPKMRRHHRGQAFVQVHGQTIWLGRHGDPATREAYDRFVATWLQNGRELPPPEDDADEPPTVTEALLAFWRHAKTRYSSKRGTISQAIKHARALYGTTEADKFGPRRLRTVRASMVEREDGDGHTRERSRSYVNECVAWIVRAFRWAGSHELVDPGLYRRLQSVEPLRPGEGGREPRQVTPPPRGAVRATWPHLSRPLRGLILLGRLTGARPGELVHLRAVDIDMSGAVWKADLAEHKNAHRGKRRTVYFGPRAQRVLAGFIGTGRDVNKPLFSPRDGNADAKARQAVKGQRRRPNQRPNATQGIKPYGDAYTPCSYRRAITRACDAAGIARWTPNQLRHEAATRIRARFGLEDAALILGHSSAIVTDAVYAERDESKVVAAISKVG